MTELRIVRGEPSDEELAALVAALTALVWATPDQLVEGGTPVRRSAWADRSALVRRFDRMRPGPRAWRNSALPT